MLHSQKRQASSWCNIFTICFTVLNILNLVTANAILLRPDFGNSGSGDRDVVFTIDDGPEMQQSVSMLDDRTSIVYFPTPSAAGLRTARMISGPPGIGCAFFNTASEDGTNFASKAMYTPRTEVSYPGATDRLSEPFGPYNYVVFFRLPAGYDPNHIVAAVGFSTDYADPVSRNPGFHYFAFNFNGQGALRGRSLDEPINMQHMAFLHAPNPNTRMQLINRQKTNVVDITPQSPLLEPFDSMRHFVIAESPLPGDLLTPEQFRSLE